MLGKTKALGRRFDRRLNVVHLRDGPVGWNFGSLKERGRLPQGCLNDILAGGPTQELGVQPGKESGDRGPAGLQPRRRLIPPNGAPKRSWRIRKAPRASAPGPRSPRGGAKVLWTACAMPLIGSIERPISSSTLAAEENASFAAPGDSWPLDRRHPPSPTFSTGAPRLHLLAASGPDQPDRRAYPPDRRAPGRSDRAAA